MSTSTTSATAQWQQQQKQTATSTQVKRPDIPGDYGGHSTPDLPPGTENFVVTGPLSQSTTWYLTIVVATTALALICVINLKRR